MVAGSLLLARSISNTVSTRRTALRYRRGEDRIDGVAADRAWINFVRFCWARRVVIARVEPGSAVPASVEIADEAASGIPPDGDVGWNAGIPDPA